MMVNAIDLKTYPFKLAKKDVLLNLELNIQPESKADKSRGYEAMLKGCFRTKAGLFPDGNSLFGVRLLFHRHNRQAIDIDNLIKSVFDAATGSVWVDDHQVREVAAKLITDASDMVNILIYHLEDNTGISTCAHCGKQYRRPPSQRGQYCSFECAKNAKRVTLQCKECGHDYTIPKSLAEKRIGFCSYSCSRTYWHKHSPKAPSPQTRCVDCGKKLSRREYTRCLHCAIEYRRTNAKGISKTIMDFTKRI